MNRRGADRTGPLGGAGMIGLWGASSLVTNVQRGLISLASVATNTATITAVDTANTLLFHTGQYFAPDADINQQQAFARLDLTNSTTITATRQAATNTCVVYYAALSFLPGVIRSVQTGSISFNTETSKTATITSVNTAKSLVIHNGQQTQDNNGYMSRSLFSLDLTNATTVTAQRWNGTYTGQVSYLVVEFF